MGTELKAIETRYADCRFRSRLEARWGVFFNALGIKWEYEKEGYALPSGAYLPDFWLPDFREFWLGPEESRTGCFVEVKGPAPTGLEIGLCYELSIASERPVLLVQGLPDWIGKPNRWGHVLLTGLSMWDFDQDGEIRSGLAWLRCSECGKIDVAEIHLYCCPLRDKETGQEIPSAQSDAVIGKAFRRAKSARFEHGEKG